MPDFSKIWATNSPLPTYTFTDAEYLEGWDFVDAAPPTKNQFDAWFKQTDEKLKWLYDKLNDTANAIYPVGAVYISFNSTSPSSLFGGTWTRLKDTFLLANGDSYAANTTGGSATKSISVNNLPAHNHSVNSAGAHTHTATTANNGAHNHTASSASAGTHAHTASSASNGAHTHTATTATAGAHKHDRGNMNITGKFSGVGQEFNASIGGATLTGAFYRVNTTNNPSQGARISNTADAQKDDYFGFDASRSWSGETSENGSHKHTITVNSAGAHTHTITVNDNGAHTHNITVNSNGTHNHSVTVNSNGAHTHTTNNTGGSQPLNILPPYTTVYMWKRTA